MTTNMPFRANSDIARSSRPGTATAIGTAAVQTEAIGLLAAGLAHDLNNMLAGIISTTELVSSHLTDAQDRQDLELVLDQASRASRLIRQLLAFSRQEMLTPVVNDPSRLVADMQAMLTTLVGHAIALDVAEGPPTRISIDPLAFERILVNLIVNSRNAILEAGRQRGQIRITCGRIGPAGIPGAARSFMPEGAYGIMSVEDDGPGIDDAIAARVFDPYFTTRKDGQGLGLASAFGLVKQSGGFLLHDRGPLGGARFTIYLPETEAVHDLVHLPRNGTGVTILLADDELLLRMSAARGLERLGYRVRQAADGESALSRLNMERPALLISDIRMPGMDGIELARHARARHPGLPILLISGYADEAARAAVPDLDIRFLEKPFTIKRLDESVQSLLQ